MCIPSTLTPPTRSDRPLLARALGAVLLCLAVLVPATGSAAQLRMRYVPPSRAAAWQPLAIEAIVEGDVSPERLATADVVVATPDGGFRAVPLAISRNAVFGEVPGALVRPPEVSFFLRLVDNEGTVAILPPGAPEGGVFVVPVAAVSTGVSTGAPSGRASDATGDPAAVGRGVEILSPLPGETVQDPTPEIAALFDPPLEEPWEALVLLDGADAGDAAELTAGYFVMVPAGSLAVGQHRVTFSALTATRTVERSWIFFVGEARWQETFEEQWAFPSAGPTAEPRGWRVSGRLEVGWAVVVAETTAVESVDVYLPYEETSRPVLDLFASGYDATRSFLVSAHYHPVYDERLQWLLSYGSRSLDVEVGDVFPSLSSTTLDWASGLGGHLVAKLGSSRTELVAMRMSEADTLGGFGLYSRFALGAKESFRWGEGVGPSLVVSHVFDREGSVPEEQRLSDPLRNTVGAAMFHARQRRLVSEVEFAISSTEGEFSATGTAARAFVGYEKDYDNRVFLEYIYNEPSYYSAGSFEREPGDRGFELEFAYRPGRTLKASGLVSVFRALDAVRGIDQHDNEVRMYGRVDAYWSLAGGSARAYVAGRYDRIPYVEYEYVYRYGMLGGAWRQGRVRASANASWARTRSPDDKDLWTVGGDLWYELVPGTWTARGAARWSAGSAADGGTDYTRAHYTVESRWTVGGVDLDVEYWLVDRDDRAAPEQAYTEHVLTATVGRSF